MADELERIRRLEEANKLLSLSYSELSITLQEVVDVMNSITTYLNKQ